MGPKKWTRTKRLLEDSYCQNRNNEREMQAIPISDTAEEQESHFTGSSRGTYSKTQWTRTKTLLEDSHCQNDNDEIEMQGIPVCDSSEEHKVHFSRSSRGIQLVMSKENQCLKHQQNSKSYSTTKFNHTPKRFRTREQSSVAIANSSLSANRISNLENPGTSQVLQSSSNSEFVKVYIYLAKLHTKEVEQDLQSNMRIQEMLSTHVIIATHVSGLEKRINNRPQVRL
ncbi:uncharacterized protein LOC112197045 [Rosa chinensis]|uniref:uncharacterized protein LOC112197045 n=1 Tax=Rosa chinensis TaxID=74649 RepID=UPI001AD8DB01|nr:uncharacterized protein LOC112197045 [Rosa chinensis]